MGGGGGERGGGCQPTVSETVPFAHGCTHAAGGSRGWRGGGTRVLKQGEGQEFSSARRPLLFLGREFRMGGEFAKKKRRAKIAFYFNTSAG